MASFWRKLFNQVNPFDGGKTWDTTANRKKPGYRQDPRFIREQQARQQAEQQPQGQGRPQPQSPQRAPQPTAPKVNLNRFIEALAKTQGINKPTYGKGINGVINSARDVFDANSPMDRYKRNLDAIKQNVGTRAPMKRVPLNETYIQQQNRLGNMAGNNAGQQLVQQVGGFSANIAKTAKDAYEAKRGIDRAYGKKLQEGTASWRDTAAKLTLDAMTGSNLPGTPQNLKMIKDTLEGVNSKKSSRSLVRKASKKFDKDLRSRDVLGSRGMLTPEEANNLSVGDIAGKSGVYGLGGAAEILPATKGYNLATTPVKGQIGKSLAKNAAGDLATGVTSDVAFQAQDKKKGIDLRQSALAGLSSVGLGALGFGVGSKFSPKSNGSSLKLKKLDQRGSVQLPRSVSGANDIAGPQLDPRLARGIAQQPLSSEPSSIGSLLRKRGPQGVDSIDNSLQVNGTPKQIKVKGPMSDEAYKLRFGKDRGGKNVKVKPFAPENYAFDKWTDKSSLGLGRETLDRNLDKVAGADAPRIKKFLVDQSRKNETARSSFLTSKRNEVKSYVVDQLGIKPKSKESSLVQRYGEGLIDDNQLVKEGGIKAPQIAEAAKYFRNQYDNLLDEWNSVRARYGYDPVPKRSDYFRHFQEINDAINIFGVIKNSRDLPTAISGKTDIFRPNKPFSNAELRRLGTDTTQDAVSGFDNYLDSVSRQIYHTDTVQRGRYIENMIRKQSESNPEVKLPNFVANLGEWTNLVSGKKSRIDRAAEQLLGRKVYEFTNTLKQRTGANMVGANLSSAVTNFIPFTQSISTTSKPAAIQGIADALRSPFKGNIADIDGVKSGFLTRRFTKGSIANSGLKRASEVASTPFKLVDEFTSRSIVAGKYFENKAKGMNPQSAMKAADDYASKVLTDRSLGQLPNLIETRTLGFLTQFQAEVNNQVSFLVRDIPEFANGNKAKIASTLTQFVVFSYLFNGAYEKVLGRRPQIDPIQAVLDIYGGATENDGDSNIKNVVGSLGKASERITTGLPVASIFTGGRLPVNAGLPDFSALNKGIQNIGNSDGKPVLSQLYKGVSGPAFYLGMPFGGGQAKKTVEGLSNFIRGKSTTPSGRDRFEIKKSPGNLVKSTLFGQYSTDEGKQYIKGLKDNKSGKSGTLKLSKSGSNTGTMSTEDIIKGQFTTKEQKNWLKLSMDEKKKLAKTNEDAKTWLNQYNTTKRINKANPDRPAGLSKESAQILNWHSKRTKEQKDKLAYTQNDYEYKLERAKLEQNKLKGMSKPDLINAEQKLKRYEVGAKFSKDTRDVYGKLTKAEILALTESDSNGEAIYNDALAYGDALVEAGVIKKNKLRSRTRIARKGRRKGRGRGRGRKGGRKIAKSPSIKFTMPKIPALRVAPAPKIKIARSRSGQNAVRLGATKGKRIKVKA